MKNSDAVLVLRAAVLGDKRAFGKLVVQYQSSVRRFFLHLTNGDEELSKDLAQDTFVKAWLKISSFRAAAKFSTWLYRIAYNTFYDYNRMNKASLIAVESDIAEQLMVSEAKQTDMVMDFTKSLAILSEYEKTAMLLFYMEDLTIHEISKIMKCPAGTVKSHLSRGKKRVSEYLKHAGYDR